MIITLGILSIFQITFLPGLVVSQLVKLRGMWNIILVSLALSPIINYLLVFITTVLGLYNQPVTLMFFGIELAFLIYLTYPILNKTLGQIFKYQEIAIFFDEYLNKNNDTIGWIKIFTKIILAIIFSFAVFVILYYISIYAALKSSVFTTWDAVVSWDRWAVDWYNNHLPIQTWHYPQLIPANWSLTYQFMGDSRIKFFAKDFMGFIEVYILLTIFTLGIVRREVGYFFGVIFTAWLQWVLGSRGNGYVDSSVAFFALSSVACLLISEKGDNQSKSIYIYLGAIFAAGAAVTKQAGLWVVLAYPFLLFFINNKEENRRYVYSHIPGILVIYTLIIFPWYGYKEYQIRTSKEVSEISYVISLVDPSKSWPQRLENSFTLIKDHFKLISERVIVVLLSFLMIFAYNEKFYKVLLGLIIIPFTLLWALYFSYDTRNLNLVIPLIGLAAGIGLQKILNKLKQIDIFYIPIKILSSIKIVYLLIPILFVFLLPLRYSDTYMINKSIAKQKQIGYPWLNQRIYEHQSRFGFDGKILTDYQYLGFLPGLEQYYSLGHSNFPLTFIKQINDTSVGYTLLNSDWASPEVIEYVRQNITDGTMQIIFEENTFVFLTICHGPCSQ